MYKCSSRFYEYKNGHVHKHIHLVHLIAKGRYSSSTGCGAVTLLESSDDDVLDMLVYAKSVAVSTTGTFIQ